MQSMYIYPYKLHKCHICDSLTPFGVTNFNKDETKRWYGRPYCLDCYNPHKTPKQIINGDYLCFEIDRGYGYQELNINEYNSIVLKKEE
jgi:hypothetical protein